MAGRTPQLHRTTDPHAGAAADRVPTGAGDPPAARRRSPARTVLLTAVLAGGIAGLGLSAAHPEWFDASTATAGLPSSPVRISGGGTGGVSAPLVLESPVVPVLPLTVAPPREPVSSPLPVEPASVGSIPVGSIPVEPIPVVEDPTAGTPTADTDTDTATGDSGDTSGGGTAGQDQPLGQ